MSENKWIEEQKQNKLFSGGGQGSDAKVLLEHSMTNRVISVRQARKFTSARYLGKILGVSCYSELCDMLEQAQMCVDSQSRLDYMKVAIEQWQGKLSNLKKITMENII